MMSNIPLHHERGLDPHLCFCQRCGGKTNAITVGVVMKGKSSKGVHYYQQGRRGEVEKSIDEQLSDVVCVEEHERVPDTHNCEKCQTELNEHKRIVEDGGVFFKCKTCDATGVLRAKSQLAIEVRREVQRTADKEAAANEKAKFHDDWYTARQGTGSTYIQCGVEFDNCKQHTVEP